MADEVKTADVPKDTKVEETPAAPAAEPTKVDEPAEEVKPAEPEAPAATEDKPAEEAAKPAEEAPKEEAKPVESGTLSHKAQGLSFPKNLIPSKEFFFFGTDAFEPKALDAYKKSEKTPATAHSNIAWASHTGSGLLFVGDKKAPTGVINLSDATEPETDGTHKFFFTSKGNKHSFKAATPAERDSWVSQLKLKIAEAKELATTVTETEIYKSTIESFKPAPIVKKEPAKPVEEAAKPAEEAPKEETPAVEAPKEPETTEAAPAPKATKSKRASIFGFVKEKLPSKPEEAKPEEAKPAEETAKPAEEAPKEETPAPAPVEEAAKPAEPVATEDKPAEEAAKPVEEAAPVEETKPVETPKASKRNSFFGGVFAKKDKKPAEATEAPKEPEAAPVATETAPVIPPVESTTPLAVAVDEAAPAEKPAETPVAPATNGESSKKDVKEKRKSSLNFPFGKREKSPSPEGEKSTSPFSKIRATIKGKSAAPKTEEKEKVAEEAPKEETPAVEAPKEPETKETVPAPEAPVTEETKPVAEETKPEPVAATTPAVTAAA